MVVGGKELGRSIDRKWVGLRRRLVAGGDAEDEGSVDGGIGSVAGGIGIRRGRRHSEKNRIEKAGLREKEEETRRATKVYILD